jgi:hypothetical protein
MDNLVERYNEAVRNEARRQGVEVTPALVAANEHDVLDWAVRGATQRLHNMKSNRKHNNELKGARELLKRFKAAGKSIADFDSSETDEEE